MLVCSFHVLMSFLEKLRRGFRLLPNYFVFSGGIDTTSALISHPNLLIRKDGYAPLLYWFI